MAQQKLNLVLESNRQLSLNPDRYIGIKQELIEFLEGEPELCTKTFAKKVMFSHEIKANNQVEGYGDDIEVVEHVIKKASDIKDLNQRKRILNLYRGYKYILSHHDINPDSVRELNRILSNGLLSEKDLAATGDYYRTGPVYILKNGRIDGDYSMGADVENIDRLMDCYFDFLAQDIDGDITDEYIKSQIMHYYFVYIHPYRDVNGRTSRTIAMWHLLNKECYPYIIFNRGISFKDREYDKVITDARTYGDLTFFIGYMLTTVKEELEKELVMQIKAASASEKLTAIDYQSLLYFLTIHGERTVLDFATIYNRFNDKKRVREIYETMIVPLLDKGVLDITRETPNLFDHEKNKVLRFRTTDDIDLGKVKRLQL